MARGGQRGQGRGQGRKERCLARKITTQLGPRGSLRDPHPSLLSAEPDQIGREIAANVKFVGTLSGRGYWMGPTLKQLPYSFQLGQSASWTFAYRRHPLTDMHVQHSFYRGPARVTLALTSSQPGATPGLPVVRVHIHGHYIQSKLSRLSVSGQ